MRRNFFFLVFLTEVIVFFYIGRLTETWIGLEQANFLLLFKQISFGLKCRIMEKFKLVFFFSSLLLWIRQRKNNGLSGNNAIVIFYLSLHRLNRTKTYTIRLVYTNNVFRVPHGLFVQRIGVLVAHKLELNCF